MRRMDGTTRVNDDEWYTPRETCDKIANWLATDGGLDLLKDRILCPADILPDGTESAMPVALRERGFENVRVTRDLPVNVLFADHIDGEIIVTNPPFSLLVPFRKWLKATGTKYCVLSRPATLHGWPVPVTKDRFKSTDGRTVAAAWMQNLVDTSRHIDPKLAIGNCRDCERSACPNNSMTCDWTPGKPRPLFGWCHAVNHGINGNWCRELLKDGNDHSEDFLLKRSVDYENYRFNVFFHAFMGVFAGFEHILLRIYKKI